MPAHPTFFLKTGCYRKYGFYKTNYQIAADFELLARLFVKYGVSYSYISKVLVRMRNGGISTRSFHSNVVLNQEIFRACAENGIKTNVFKIYSKYFSKIFQLVNTPKEIDFNSEFAEK